MIVKNNNLHTISYFLLNCENKCKNGNKDQDNSHFKENK